MLVLSTQVLECRNRWCTLLLAYLTYRQPPEEEFEADLLLQDILEGILAGVIVI